MTSGVVKPLVRRPSGRRNSLLSAAEVMVNALCLFFIYRNVVQELGVSMLGVWALVLATTSFGRAADLGISGGLTRFVARAFGEGEPSKAVLYMRTGLLFMAVGMGAVALVLWIPLWYSLSIALDGHQLAAARDVLPWAILSLWLLFMKTAIDSCLLGVHRADVRSLAGMTGMILQLVLSLALAAPFGLRGLAWAQAAYYALAISLEGVFLIALLRRRRPSEPPQTQWFSLAQLREMLGFGVKLQVGSVFNLLFDPLVKTLLGAVGGAAFLGVVEIAYRTAYTARNVVVQALQPALAVFAELSGERGASLAEQFVRVCRVGALATATVMSLVAVGSPVLSWLYLGHVDSRLVYATSALSLAWAVTALAAPAYYLGLATGRVLPYAVSEGLAALVGGASVYLVGHWVSGEAAVFGVLAGKLAGAMLLGIVVRPSRGLRESLVATPVIIKATAVVASICGLVAWVGATKI